MARPVVVLAGLMALWPGAGARRLHARAPSRPRLGRGVVPAAVLAAAGGAVRARAQWSDADAEAENFFAQYDTNRDGTVDAHEFVGAALRHLEDMHVTDPATVESVAAYHERLLAVCDIDGDGLSQREFECMEYVAAYSLPSRVQTRIAALVGEARSDTDEFGLRSAVSEVKRSDLDGDGVISKSEFTVAMEETLANWGSQYVGESFVAQWLEDLFVKVDLNDDGTLSAQEVLFTSLVSDEALRTGPFSPPALADRILRDLDVDMDGRLRDTEVQMALEQERPARELEQRAADEAQADGAGGGPGAAQPKSLAEAVRLHFAEADADGDGALSRQEVKALARRLIGVDA